MLSSVGAWGIGQIRMVSRAFLGTWAISIFTIVFLPRGSEGWLLPNWRSVCYDSPPIGCFDTSNSGYTPEDPEVIPTYFYSYRDGMPEQVFTVTSAEQLMLCRYDPAKKTVLIIHGYLEDNTRGWIQTMLNELRKKEDANYITVNWGIAAGNIHYYQSVANARVVGAVIALVLQTLQTLGGDPAMFHLIGYSLGAHVAGYAGSRVAGLGRITGLDPAGLEFTGHPAPVRLDPTDALFVDVIHTGGASFGTMQVMGHVDFYPNGGASQRGCPSGVFDFLTAIATFSIVDGITCDHFRVLDLFSASINNVCPPYYLNADSHRISWSNRTRYGDNDPDGENWQRCDSDESCPLMGYNLDPASVELSRQQHQGEGGNLLVTMSTTSTWPFC